LAKEVLMPKLGLTMEKGEITEWYVEEGEEVTKGEPLFELMTDKITNIVEAPASGTLLKVLFEAGEEVPVGQVLAFIGEEGEEIDSLEKEAEIPEEENQKLIETKKQAKKEEKGKLLISPRAKRKAETAGIDPNIIEGSGPRGRITEEDVQKFIQAKEPSPTAPSTEKTLKKTVPLNQLREVIASRMVESFTKIPHFSLEVELDASNILKARETKKGEDQKLSINAFLMKASALALKNHPRVNASFLEGKIHEWEEINIGLAVALEDGLIVPVVKKADSKSISQLDAEIADLVQKARAGQLESGDISGGTFTISNLGGFGIDSFKAIINPPEAAILAVGQIRETAVVSEGIIKPAPILKLTLSADHRILDGAAGARFLVELKENLLAIESF